MPSVIIKLIYVDDKNNNIWKSRKLNKTNKNEINDQNMYMNEHLPNVYAELNNGANKFS